MLRLAPLSKNFRESGALNENVPIFGFIDDHTFLTKPGDLGLVLKVEGVDYECLDPQQLDYFTKRLQAALRLFDANYRVYQYLFKSNDPDISKSTYENPVVAAAMEDRFNHFAKKRHELYTIEIYYVILYQAFRHKTDFLSALKKFPRAPREALSELKGLFATEKQITVVEGAIEKAKKPLHRTVSTVLLQLADFVSIRMLEKQDAFVVLKRLLNFDPAKIENARLKYDTNVDYFLCDSHVDCHPSYLTVDDYHVRVLTLKEPTAQSWPLVLKQLYEIPASYHVVSEWHTIDNLKAKARIERHRRHFHNTKTSLMSQAADAGSDVLVDDSKAAMVDSLAALKKEIEINGNCLGEFSMSVVVYDRDPTVVDKACAEVYKVWSVNDGAVYEESYNLLNAFFATLPGNYHFNLRLVDVLNTNYADYSFLFTLLTGDRVSRHLGQEYLAVLETNHKTPFYYNLHHGDVAHTLMLGMTGSGKSFLLNFLVVNAQKYDPSTFIFDLGGSYAGITKLLGGAYLRVGIESRDFTINPFTLPATKENLNFLFALVKVLVEGNGQYVLTTADDKDLYSALENLYQIDPRLRRLKTLSHLLRKDLGERLARWVSGGQYDFVFDNDEDTLSVGRFQCFDFEGMARYPDVIQPLLFYVLHRANDVIYDPALSTRFKLFVMDEAWRFFEHPTTRTYIVEALKTWRKKNAGMVLATQSLDELSKSEIVNVVNESCPTKIFLANPDMDRDFYKETFHLNETELSLIEGLIPKRQFLVKRPDFAKVLNLEVDRKSYFLYTNDPNDNFKRDQAIRAYGFEQGLEMLARS